MSLDISNPCGNMFLAVAGFKDNLRTSPPQNATLVQGFGLQTFVRKSKTIANVSLDVFHLIEECYDKT